MRSLHKKNIRTIMHSQIESKDIFEQAKSYAFDYMDKIDKRDVFPGDNEIKSLKIFNEPLPEKSCEPADVLGLLHKYGSPATVAQTGDRYFGFVNVFDVMHRSPRNKRFR